MASEIATHSSRLFITQRVQEPLVDRSRVRALHREFRVELRRAVAALDRITEHGAKALIERFLVFGRWMTAIPRIRIPVIVLGTPLERTPHQFHPF